MSESEATLEDTPTWIVASVCSVIVLISLVFERGLHHLGKALERRRVTLYEALLKLKEELMMLGFISLLLVVFQNLIQKICIDESLMEHWLPCRNGKKAAVAHYVGASSTFAGGGRRLLTGGAAFGHCLSKMHIFIFVLAITHVALSAVTVLLGLLQMRKWMHWENNIQEEGSSAPKMIKRVQKIKFIQDRCKGHEKFTWIIIWMRSFFKQFYGSVSNDDYVSMRLGFVMLLLLIGTKLEHIINKLAYEVASKHAVSQGEGGAVMRLSDELFWFHSPRLVLVLIHFILFQNAFEFAYFFWTLAMFGANSCIMDRLGYSISRIVICVIVQVLCSYSTLPLYAIVSHMGSSFKSAVFADDVADHLRGWADEARQRMRRSATTDNAGCLGAPAAGRRWEAAGWRSMPERSAAQLRSISF
nr:unnamed protein product [Digitaria exilis]